MKLKSLIQEKKERSSAELFNLSLTTLNDYLNTNLDGNDFREISKGYFSCSVKGKLKKFWNPLLEKCFDDIKIMGGVQADKSINFRFAWETPNGKERGMSDIGTAYFDENREAYLNFQKAR